jgi:hypothetical protein
MPCEPSVSGLRSGTSRLKPGFSCLGCAGAPYRRAIGDGGIEIDDYAAECSLRALGRKNHRSPDQPVNCIEEPMPRNLKQKLRPPILPRLIRIQESMQRVPVDSSSITSIGYAPEQQVLELEFRQSGEVYQYFNVPAEEHTAFLAADSKGTYLNRHFKPRLYRYLWVRPQQE